MYDRQFFASKLGIASLVSIGATILFNILVLSYQAEASPRAAASLPYTVELA